MPILIFLGVDSRETKRVI